MTKHTSPEYHRRVEAEEWNRRHAFTCSCREREVRAERGALICAQCDAPIVLRRAVAT